MINDQELDRLVDGELTEAAYADLMVRMADDPSNWRRCALAFLERQAWERELLEWARPVRSQETRVTADRILEGECQDRVSSRGSAMRRVPAWSHWLAASLLGIIFSQIVHGLNEHGVFRGRDATRSTQPLVTSNDDSQVPGDADVALKEQPAAQGTEAESSTPTDSPLANWALMLQEARRTADGAWEMPVYDLHDRRGAAALHYASNFPRDWEHQLKQAGHQVRRQRAYTPVQLDDGRQLVIPWEQVEIVPVSQTVIP